MSAQPTGPPKVSVEFDTWKLLLRKDCELQNKLPAYQALGDYALWLLWEQGIDPSVAGIVGSVGQQTPKAT